MNRSLFPGRRRLFVQEREAEAHKQPSLGTVLMSADEAMPSRRKEHGALQDAVSFLARQLANGPAPVVVVQADAQAAGHSWAAIRRAKKALGVDARKVGMRSGWVWTLLPKALKPVEDASGQDQSDS